MTDRYKRIKLTNPKYGVTGTFNIKKKYYDMHYSLHKIRPEEALQSNLTSCYGKEVTITQETIERVILDEYNMAKSLPTMILKAKRRLNESIYK